MSDEAPTRLIICAVFTALCVPVILYLSPWWPFQLWTNQHWLAEWGLHPRGNMINRWVRGWGLGPFAILIWAAVSLFLLELAQRIRR
ncbi:MAG: hypothetical protein AAF641_08185 [Pseudomonadota bacterium]